MSWDAAATRDLDTELEVDGDANAPYYDELNQAAMVEADRLQDEVEPVGPYEHTGAYVGSELFDTTGTPGSFCPHCEHAPCVAGGHHGCTMRPRFTTVGALRKEIFDLLDTQIDNPLWFSLRQAVYAMGDAARHDQGGPLAPVHAAEQLKTMAVVRDELRNLVQS